MPRRKKCHESKTSVSGVQINKGKPQQRNAANARERARMRVLSRAFCRLKTTLPWVPADTKLSKLDTLRLAASYIAHLKGILSDDHFPASTDDQSHPAMTLTWPFGFNRPTGIMGGNGSSAGGGSSEAEESLGGNSSCWDPVDSPSKDCIHLDNSSADLLFNNKLMQIQQPPFKPHDVNSEPNNSRINNNSILAYNFNPNHHPTMHSYGFQQHHNHNESATIVSLT